MTRSIDLASGANWQSLYTTTLTATAVNANTYNPIAEFEVPLLLNSSICAVLVTSASASPNWRFAGMLYQRTFLGLTGIGGVPDADAVSRRKIFLNRVQLLMFDPLIRNYSIAFAAPHWFKDLKFTLWQYVGDDERSTGLQLTDIQSQLERIEMALTSN